MIFALKKTIYYALLPILAICLVSLVACGGENVAPKPESDSHQQFNTNAEVPVDDIVYTIIGVVDGDVDSLTRQVSPASGSYSSYDGYDHGSYFGPVLEGKGLVRLMVETAVPETNLAEPGFVVLLKVTDTKAIVLQPGDRVTFRCRAQYEAVAAVRNWETFDAERNATWELDYCRIFSPKIELTGGR